MSMHPNSKASQALNVLRESPSTTGEVAAELGWTVRLTHAHLQKLERTKRITRSRFETGCKRVKYLWSVVPGLFA